MILAQPPDSPSPKPVAKDELSADFETAVRGYDLGGAKKVLESFWMKKKLGEDPIARRTYRKIFRALVDGAAAVKSGKTVEEQAAEKPGTEREVLWAERVPEIMEESGLWGFLRTYPKVIARAASGYDGYGKFKALADIAKGIKYKQILDAQVGGSDRVPRQKIDMVAKWQFELLERISNRSGLEALTAIAKSFGDKEIGRKIGEKFRGGMSQEKAAAFIFEGARKFLGNENPSANPDLLMFAYGNDIPASKVRMKMTEAPDEVPSPSASPRTSAARAKDATGKLIPETAIAYDLIGSFEKQLVDIERNSNFAEQPRLPELSKSRRWADVETSVEKISGRLPGLASVDHEAGHQLEVIRAGVSNVAKKAGSRAQLWSDAVDRESRYADWLEELGRIEIKKMSEEESKPVAIVQFKKIRAAQKELEELRNNRSLGADDFELHDEAWNRFLKYEKTRRPREAWSEPAKIVLQSSLQAPRGILKKPQQVRVERGRIGFKKDLTKVRDFDAGLPSKAVSSKSKFRIPEFGSISLRTTSLGSDDDISPRSSSPVKNIPPTPRRARFSRSR